MMATMSEDAKAILLLCGRFGGVSEIEPLDQWEYNQVVRWLRSENLRPADLLSMAHVPALAKASGIPEGRLSSLLKRGVKLGFAVEKWNQSGIWVICRSDPDYPSRYKSHLKDKAPPVLFGAGERSLLAGGGLAIVGSRNVDAEGEAFTREVAAWCARGGMPVVSGGARGVDQFAMSSSLEAGGAVIGVLADTLLRKSVSREARTALADGRLLLLSPYHPEAGFNVGNAMGRNKLIYALADYGLVVSADLRKGGTWAGAQEELKRSPGRPVFVRMTGTLPPGNRKLLELGAIELPALAIGLSPAGALSAAAASKPTDAKKSDLPLFDLLQPVKPMLAMVREAASTPEEEPVARPFGDREGLALEFKRAGNALPGNFFETVCGFLNMDGGLIVLGVEDDGRISGVESGSVARIMADIANLSNNPQKLDPPYLLFPHEEQIDGKRVIKVQVPASSQVHRTGGEVFLRSENGDYRIKDPYQVAGLVNRKQSFYTEQRVLPWLGMGDLRPDLFDQARALLNAQRRNHPWAKLRDEELLQIGGFIRKDPQTSVTGYTLASALMFGSDATIQQSAPAMVFDALLRRNNVDRYDDRVMLYTNLIEAFDGLMAFVEKHLNDPFYLEGTERVSLRDRIFRELVSNLIAHREYTSAAPATLTVFRNKVVFRNPHVPHLQGRIDPKRFTPFPKNPTICRFMLQMGRYEQAGSGVYNVTKYLPIYTPGASPVFEEYADVFETTIPLEVSESGASAQVTAQVEPERISLMQRRLNAIADAYPIATGQVTGQVAAQVMVACEVPRKATELQSVLGIRHRETFLNNYLHPLLASGWIELTIPDKPQSRLQKYRLTAKGRALLAGPAKKT